MPSINCLFYPNQLQRQKRRIEKFSFILIYKDAYFASFGVISPSTKSRIISVFGIRAQSDGLFEVSRILACSVVSNLNGSGFARQYGFLGIFGNCTSTGSYGLMYNQRSIAHIGECEYTTYYRIIFRKTYRSYVRFYQT